MKEKKATDSEKYQGVIQALISARKDRKVWQTDIAAKMKKPQSFVSKYENYERRLDMVEFVDVCRAIGVSPVTIMMQAGLIDDDDLKENATAPPKRPKKK